MVFLCQGFHLVFSESKEGGHPSWFHHGILDEVIQGRLRLIFLDRKDARHIDTSEYLEGFPALKHPAQPVHIAVHGH